MEKYSNFRDELQRRTGETEEIIRRFLPKGDRFSGDLADAMNYGMTAGGKRLRPLLMREAYRMFGGSRAVIEPFMAAIEMIHTHSLIHDDLPAIDNDAYRRGKPTTHAVYGEAMGILAGDALLNYAYETALQAFLYPEVPAEKVAAALRILANKTGIHGMLAGQCLDVQNEKMGNRTLDRDTLSYIYLNKTAALLEAPLMIGAVLAGADRQTAAAMEDIGEKAGLAFQIQDDILDVTGTAEEIGKPVGSDARNDKTTYVTLMGTEEAAMQVKKLTAEAIRMLQELPGDSTFLAALLAFMAERRS